MAMYFTIPEDITVAVFSRTGRGLHSSTSQHDLSRFLTQNTL
jgi:hypothetical protein